MQTQSLVYFDSEAASQLFSCVKLVAGVSPLAEYDLPHLEVQLEVDLDPS